jgi:hypothetical protein
MNASTELAELPAPSAKALKLCERKRCARCARLFVPSRPYQKRHPRCAQEHQRDLSRARWHRTYVKKGYDQAAEKNNNWKGGRSPKKYRQICFDAHGDNCFKCGEPATLAHHLDEDRTNNSPENLRPMCKRCHQLEHNCTANLPKPGSLKSKRCSDCPRWFKPCSGRAFRCSRCRLEHLRQVAREKYRRKLASRTAASASGVGNP